MPRFSYFLLGAFLLSLFSLAPEPAEAQTPVRKVQDDAEFFSKEAKEKANAALAKIKHAHKKEVFIETVKSIPLPGDWKDLSEKERKAVMQEWAESRFAQWQVDGVYIGIVTGLHQYQIEVGRKTKETKIVVKADRDKVSEILSSNFKAKEPDKALLEVVDYLAAAMDKNAAAAADSQVKPLIQKQNRQPVAVPQKTVVAPQPKQEAQQEEGFPAWVIWVGVFVVALLVFWIIMGVVRGMSGGVRGGAPGPGGYGGGGYGGGGGGGGFFSSLLGGMFGAAAGMWMYNSFFGGHSSSAYGGEHNVGAGGTDAARPADTDVGAGTPDSTGGSWDDSAGGADAGNPDPKGDDGGGGDWGSGGNDGGDAGGGGGDWGGGGGGDLGGGGGGDWGGGGGGGDW